MAAPAGWVPERAEVIWMQHSPHVGAEMPGMHPMLVTSMRSFNEHTGIVIGFPMTHAAFNKDNPFAVSIKGPKEEVAYILAFQPKSFDWREWQAFPHNWGGGHHVVLDKALEMMRLICGIDE